MSTFKIASNSLYPVPVPYRDASGILVTTALSKDDTIEVPDTEGNRASLSALLTVKIVLEVE